MQPIKFKESNKTLTKPKNMTDEECSSLHIFNDGMNCISCWEFTDVEIEELNRTKQIWLKVVSGNSQPPVLLTVYKPFYMHPKAYRHMVYESQDHLKRIMVWNSRDGMVPLSYFVGDQEYFLISGEEEVLDDQYKPRTGDYIFRDRTVKESEDRAKAIVDKVRKLKTDPVQEMHEADQVKKPEAAELRMLLVSLAREAQLYPILEKVGVEVYL